MEKRICVRRYSRKADIRRDAASISLIMVYVYTGIDVNSHMKPKALSFLIAM